jgi:tRNA nucleotidyltransferase (CCA-adding enzyme)
MDAAATGHRSMSRKSATTQHASAGWELLPHDADVRIHGWGPNPEVAFEQTALALTAVVTDAEVAGKTAVAVTCKSENIELLLVEWLNAIIYEMAVGQMLFGRFEVKIDGARLEGDLWGEPVDQVRHKPACEPKGATYTALRVEQGTDGRWTATCVVDV